MLPIRDDIFREYDIRGVIGKDFDDQWVEILGKALGTYFRNRGWDRAVIGHDCRRTSPTYQDCLLKGLCSAGIDVTFLGHVSTPVFYFAASILNFQAGVMITASHNPPQFNGFKVWGGTSTLYGRQIRDILAIMQSGTFARGQGIAAYHDITPTYVDNLANRVKPGKTMRPVKVVLDGGNGSGGPVTAAVLRKAGAEVTELYCTPDGTFPNHHPDPTIDKNMSDLKEQVKHVGADLGIGLDGDGDRIGAVTEKGEMLYGDQLTAILAREELARNPGAIIVGDVKCSHLMFRDIEQHGGRAVMSATGHSLMKARIKELGAPLGGELSGHMFFFGAYLGFDDATYAALKLVEIVSKADKPLSRFLEDWPVTHSTPEIHLPCPDQHKAAVVAKAQETFSALYDTATIDGARCTFADGWALVRASNTQPVLTLRFEAETRERLDELREMIEPPVRRWVREIAEKEAL